MMQLRGDPVQRSNRLIPRDPRVCFQESIQAIVEVRDVRDKILHQQTSARDDWLAVIKPDGVVQVFEVIV